MLTSPAVIFVRIQIWNNVSGVQCLARTILPQNIDACLGFHHQKSLHVDTLVTCFSTVRRGWGPCVVFEMNPIPNMHLSVRPASDQCQSSEVLTVPEPLRTIFSLCLCGIELRENNEMVARLDGTIFTN